MKKKNLLKRIEALEKESSFSLRKLEAVEKCLCAANDIFISLENQPCETVAKFKRIADYAQAITEEIATPRKTLCKHQYEDVNEFLVKCKYCGDKVAI